MNLPMSMEGACIPERSIAKLMHLPKKRVTVLVVNAAPTMRYVSTAYVGGRKYLVDCATGTLYNPDDGGCLSSNHMRLDLSTVE